ncbi:MAG: protease HtpX [Pseudobdellovibrionaceae bacterium]
MGIAKRVILFVAVNILIVTTLSIVMSALGIQPYLDAKGINYGSLMAFCAVWGFGGAFISLALSRVMAKWMMGVKLVDKNDPRSEVQFLIHKIHKHAKSAGLEKMPEIGIYESPEINAFATGPSKSRSLVAVSTGLLSQMNENEIDGVLAHEVAHIANGDMVTMTLVQGVVNAFVMFFARIIGFFASQFVDEEKRSIVQFGIVLVAEILLGILGMIVVSAFSRRREFKADAGAAQLTGKANMIAALEKLKFFYENKLNPEAEPQGQQSALATLKISGKSGGFLKLFSTHPNLDDRIQKLKTSSITRPSVF